MERREVFQPIHPSLRHLLDPEYVSFHDNYIQYVFPDELKIWDGSARTQPSLPAGGGSMPVRVKRIVDVSLEHCRLRIYIPEPYRGAAAEPQLPALLWFHAGGWALGGLDSESDFCSYICQCLCVTLAAAMMITDLLWSITMRRRHRRLRSRTRASVPESGGGCSGSLAVAFQYGSQSVWR